MIKDNSLFLYEDALKAMKNAYVPYSKFQVGCAILLDDGQVISGCNVENASYGLCNCAERTALFTLYAAGYKKMNILSLTIIAATERPISPCGACRQVISELVPKEIPIFMTNLKKDLKTSTIAELLPYSFDEEDLN